MGKRQAARKSEERGNALAQRAMIAATHPGGWVKASVGADPESVVSQPWNSITLTFVLPGSNAISWVLAEALANEVVAQSGMMPRATDYNFVLKVKRVAAWCPDSLMLSFRQLATTNNLTVASLPALTVEDHPGRLAFARVAAQAPAPVVITANGGGNVQVFGYKTASTASVYFKVHVEYRVQKDSDAPVAFGFEQRASLQSFAAERAPTRPSQASGSVDCQEHGDGWETLG